MKSPKMIIVLFSFIIIAHSCAVPWVGKANSSENENAPVTKGEDVEIFCTLSIKKEPQSGSDPMFIDVEWTKEDRGEEILKKEEFSLTNLSLTGGEIQANYTVKKGHYWDSGKYWCTFRYRQGPDQTNASVDVYAQPSLKGIPVMDKDKADRRNFRRPGENVYIGENVEIKYHFHSYPAAEFSLFKTVEYPQYTYALNPRGLYDQLLALALEKVNITDRIICTETTFSISNAQESDRAMYVIVATNEIGNISLYALVRVKSFIDVIWPLIGIIVTIILTLLSIWIGGKYRKNLELEMERKGINL